MLKKVSSFLSKKYRVPFVKNSLWGIVSNVTQNILFSTVFIIIARKYSTDDFAGYVIANTLYAFVVSFSSLGLGQWFIRELMNTEDKKALVNKFFKMQLYIGIFFYAVNVIWSYALYTNPLIRSLSLLIGINVIFDNLIYVIKQINIAQLEQKKTFVILTTEAFLKLLIASLLFISPIPILWLSSMLILLRFVTLNLFIRVGSSKLVSFVEILKTKVVFKEIRKIIISNYAFLVISSISVVYWRIGNILVSKVLTLKDVTNYDISLKLWSIAIILPVIVSTSLYPMLVNSFKKSILEMHRVYKKAFLAYAFYGLLSYTFIFSFSDFFIPLLFGEKYISVPQYCKELFLTALLVPTALLQANVFIAMKLEKLDMLFNLISLIIYLFLCGVGFYYLKSLSVINYGIFFSFLAFHILQDIALIKRKISTFRHTLLFYAGSTSCVLIYHLFSKQLNAYILFFTFWCTIIFIFFMLRQFLLKREVIFMETDASM